MLKVSKLDPLVSRLLTEPICVSFPGQASSVTVLKSNSSCGFASDNSFTQPHLGNMSSCLDVAHVVSCSDSKTEPLDLTLKPGRCLPDASDET